MFITERRPEQSRLIDVLPIQELAWELSFEMIIMEAPSDGLFRNIFHFTIGDNGSNHGDRTPAMWIRNQELDIAFNTEISKSKEFFFDIPAINEKFSFKLEQVVLSDDRPTIRLFINGELINQLAHNWKTLFRDVKFFIGDPWYTTAPVKIWNLKYTQREI